MLVRNETIEGATIEEVKEISRQLEQLRAERPSKFKNYITMKEAMESDAFDIDWPFFWEIVNEAESHYFAGTLPGFRGLPVDRYLMTAPIEGDIGGFYGRPCGGYYYFNDLGFCTPLNPEDCPDKKLRTLELARCYLHDSSHAATYRTFRLSTDGKIYRHQYGFNFRNADGTSYSAPNANQFAPDTINLNTLMDAAIQLHIKNYMQFAFPYVPENASELEAAIAAELHAHDFDPSSFPNAAEYYETIIGPAHGFIENWQMDKLSPHYMNRLLRHITYAMLDGDISGFQGYLGETMRQKIQSEPLKIKPITAEEERQQLAKQKADDCELWEKMFRQPSYSDEGSLPFHGMTGWQREKREGFRGAFEAMLSPPREVPVFSIYDMSDPSTAHQFGLSLAA